MAQNSDYVCLEFHFSSNSGPSRSFRTKKSGPSQNFDTWFVFRAEIKKKVNGSNLRPSQIYMHMYSRANISFNYFLGHLRDPPYLYRRFWFTICNPGIKRWILNSSIRKLFKYSLKGLQPTRRGYWWSIQFEDISCSCADWCIWIICGNN